MRQTVINVSSCSFTLVCPEAVKSRCCPTFSSASLHHRGENWGGRVGTSSHRLPRWLAHWIRMRRYQFGVPLWALPGFHFILSAHCIQKLKGDKGVWGNFRMNGSSPQFPLCHTTIGEATTLFFGTLRLDNGVVHENFAEKRTPHPFKPFLGYPKWPSYLKEGN